MPTCFSALMCHAPIVVPAVAGDEAARCSSTTRAMREVAARAVASRPDRLVLISPHSPRREGAWGAWTGRHRGSLAEFRAPEVTVDLPDAPEVAEALGALPVQGRPLDHGAVVPLAFLWEAGWRGPTAILALPWEPADVARAGRAVAALPGRSAVIGSGDMSHRLKPGAPSGYHPRARDFDLAFAAALEAGRWEDALAAEPRELAAEDVIDSAAFAMAAAGSATNAELLSYEGPWGVGYSEAIFYDEAPPLYAIARQAIRARQQGRSWSPPAGGPPSAGVFVTLYERGELRGCIGHIEPVHARLWEEVADVAVSSAFSDPRFRPLADDELPRCEIEVSVLRPPEPVDSEAALDPRRYGVVLSAGRRRGVLLPDLEGVDTVADQLAITRRKAGIGSHEPVRIERFEVWKEAQP